MMTSPPCAPFLAITSDIADGTLERLAADTGVGSLVKPDVNRAGEGRESAKAGEFEMLFAKARRSERSKYDRQHGNRSCDVECCWIGHSCPPNRNVKQSDEPERRGGRCLQ